MGGTIPLKWVARSSIYLAAFNRGLGPEAPLGLTVQRRQEMEGTYKCPWKGRRRAAEVWMKCTHQ